jgi:NADPH-dependent 2,4-dienoyl-CoA reductase/sulfur reductase-like enzyme
MPLNSLAAQPIDSKACSDLRGDPPGKFPRLSERPHHEQQRRVLLSGARIAGLTVAYRLRRYGFPPIVVERVSSLLKGVYKIDVRGIALQVLRRMVSMMPSLQ